MTIDWIVICGDIVNPQQITHVDPRVLGRFCGAPQELEFEDHVIMALSRDTCKNLQYGLKTPAISRF